MKVYLHVKYERLIIKNISTMDLKIKFIFDLEMSTFEGQGQQQRLQWIDFMNYIHYIIEI